MPSDPEAARHPADNQNLEAKLKSAEEQLEKMKAREARMADLLKCAPERLEHDLRNVLNELQLLRTVFEADEKNRQQADGRKP